jgi:protease-4
MPITADDVIDRRQLRRKLTFWRVVAIAVAVLAIAGAAFWSMSGSLGGVGSPHIAKVRIEGTITEDEELLERLKTIRESDAVKGVILSIDSPGGTTVGGEAIFDAVRELAAAKPTVAQVGTLAASAGYMIASATDQIIARQSSIVGSIGVLVQFPNFTGAMEKLGIAMEDVKSSPLKAEPSPFNPTTEAEKEMLRRLIMDSYDWFVTLVDERRPLDRAQVLALADGSIFTGRQALANKLIDGLGGEEKAQEWLVTKGVGKDLEIVEWKKRQSTADLFLTSSLGRKIGAALGLPAIDESLLEAIGLDRMFLDGLLSVWQPERAIAGK